MIHSYIGCVTLWGVLKSALNPPVLDAAHALLLWAVPQTWQLAVQLLAESALSFQDIARSWASFANLRNFVTSSHAFITAPSPSSSAPSH